MDCPESSKDIEHDWRFTPDRVHTIGTLEFHYQNHVKFDIPIGNHEGRGIQRHDFHQPVRHYPIMTKLVGEGCESTESSDINGQENWYNISIEEEEAFDHCETGVPNDGDLYVK